MRGLGIETEPCKCGYCNFCLANRYERERDELQSENDQLRDRVKRLEAAAQAAPKPSDAGKRATDLALVAAGYRLVGGVFGEVSDG